MNNRFITNEHTFDFFLSKVLDKLKNLVKNQLENIKQWVAVKHEKRLSEKTVMYKTSYFFLNI